jgi:hypothetical protein
MIRPLARALRIAHRKWQMTNLADTLSTDVKFTGQRLDGTGLSLSVANA